MLSSDFNLYDLCIEVLKNKGFDVKLHREREGLEIEDCEFIAKKNSFEFCAANPIELLGLCNLYEVMKPIEATPSWWLEYSKEDHYTILIDELIERELIDELIEREKNRTDQP